MAMVITQDMGSSRCGVKGRPIAMLYKRYELLKLNTERGPTTSDLQALRHPSPLFLRSPQPTYRPRIDISVLNQIVSSSSS